MEQAEYNIKKFCALKGIQIIREREVQHGKQYTLHSLGDTVHLITFQRNNLVQGKESKLKEIIKSWADKSPPYDEGVRADLRSGWREWNEEANWIADFHKKHGIPKEEDLNHRYMIRREVLFHDYMFRNGSLNAVTFERFEQLVRAWFKRNCFMNHNIDSIISSLKERVNKGGYIFDLNQENIPFTIATDMLSEELANNCPNKYLKTGVCPQIEEQHFDCLSDIVDALYPYFTDKMLSYTKGNLNKLIKRDYDLKWTSILPSTPIEEKMSESLIDAGILSVPQYQAWDEKHRYNLDFVVKTPQGLNIAVECDGLQYHARPSTYIHDRKRDRYLQSKGFYMMRFSSVEIYNEMDLILKEIDEAYWKIQKNKIDIRKPYRISYFGYGEEE
ncbi:Protein of unknown function [Mariniphaga anaerophila]|uniref:Restriction endonuclease type II-like domain-containing protein n=1 Tax=Mariniphaga anaerophila TaxID=1484053 RepID=A0A1M5GKJ3_9BACT|nr:DUF559 domain-containing protein [Mariniphaga anaerophila]SHG04270.1 Protein of unknown function [Mariniphaga anaerophila]